MEKFIKNLIKNWCFILFMCIFFTIGSVCGILAILNNKTCQNNTEPYEYRKMKHVKCDTV